MRSLPVVGLALLFSALVACGSDSGEERDPRKARPERPQRSAAASASAPSPSATLAPPPPPSSTPASASPRPRGIFAVLEWGEHAKEATWQNPNVDGVVVRAYWRDLNPERARYDWRPFDAAVEAAARHGKRARFIVAPGFYSPDYVLSDPAVKRATFTVPQGPLAEKERSLPLPWDDAYLSAWFTFVDELAARYRNNPAFAYVSATGPNSHNGEISLPREPSDEKTWQTLGAPDAIEQRMLQAWEKTFRRYCAAFSGKHFTLAIISEALPGHSKDDRKSYQEKLAKLGSEVCPAGFGLQNNGLDGRPVQLDLKPLPAWDLIESYAGKILTGFQTRTRANLYHCKRSGRDCEGDKLAIFEQALKNGLTRKASFLEIYEKDLADPELKPLLDRAHAELHGR